MKNLDGRLARLERAAEPAPGCDPTDRPTATAHKLDARAFWSFVVTVQGMDLSNYSPRPLAAEREAEFRPRWRELLAEMVPTRPNLPADSEPVQWFRAALREEGLEHLLDGGQVDGAA